MDRPRTVDYSSGSSMVVSPSSLNGPVLKTSFAVNFFPASSGLGPQSAVKLPHMTPNRPSATVFPPSPRIQ